MDTNPRGKTNTLPGRTNRTYKVSSSPIFFVDYDLAGALVVEQIVYLTCSIATPC
jgi:hypothetical protein